MNFNLPPSINASDSYSSSQVIINGNHNSIKVKSNGEVKTYESDSSGDINIETSDGSAKANANVSTNIPKLSVTPTSTPQKNYTDINPDLGPLPKPISKPFFDVIKTFINKLLRSLFQKRT